MIIDPRRSASCPQEIVGFYSIISTISHHIWSKRDGSIVSAASILYKVGPLHLQAGS